MSRRVLIVDDALADRSNLERIVSGAGHVALLAESGLQAIERARRDKPDVILMDVNMPDMDGFAATRKLKADELTARADLEMSASVVPALITEKRIPGAPRHSVGVA